MSIKSTRSKDSSGKIKTEFIVVAEAINIYSGVRVQKKRRGIPSLPKAERTYKELWHECRNGKPNDFQFERWGELVTSYLESFNGKVRSSENPLGMSPKVIKTKRSHLRHTDEWSQTHLELFTQKFLMDRLDEFERRGFTRSMTVHIQKEVKCVFNYAFEVGTIKGNPFAGMKMRKLPQKDKDAFTHEEANKLLFEAKKRNHQFYYIWLLSITLGLRRSELAGLKWTDIDFNLGLASLCRQVIPGEGEVANLKSMRNRKVAIPNYVIPELKELRLQNPSDFVICVKDEQWRNGAQAKVLRSFCREIGIKEISHHSLRATHITLGLLDGVSIGAMKENVGHSKLSTTDIYFRSSGINIRGQTDALKIKVPVIDSGKLVELKARR